MQNDRVLRKHASLVDRMSDRVGVDLEEAVLRGEISPDLIPDLVLRCTTCTNPESCARLLKTTSTLDSAPSYCRNREAFEKLQ
ncbi:MAG: DUF6455 family protein [Pseudomonadota bacterium]